MAKKKNKISNTTVVLCVVLFIVASAVLFNLYKKHFGEEQSKPLATHGYTNSNPQFDPIPEDSGAIPFVNEKIAFERGGKIWVGNGDGSGQMVISAADNQQSCEYYSAFYNANPNDYPNMSAWSRDNKNIAFFCYEKKGGNVGGGDNASSKAPTAYVYNFDKKSVTYSASMAPDWSKCGGCSGMSDNGALLENNNLWDKYPDFQEIRPDWNSGLGAHRFTYTGGNVWLLDNSDLDKNNQPVGFHSLYDENQKKTIIKWDFSKPLATNNGSSIYLYNWTPTCIINPQHTDEVCWYITTGSDNEWNSYITGLSVINLSTGKATTKYGVFSNLIWSSDGSVIYATMPTGRFQYGGSAEGFLDDTSYLKVVAIKKDLTAVHDIFLDATAAFPTLEIK